MNPRTIDFSRDYGLMCPPGPGGAFVQDNICFDANGREVMPPAPADKKEADVPKVVAEPVPAAEPDVSEMVDKDELVAALVALGVKADKRSSVAKLQAALATARKGA